MANFRSVGPGGFAKLLQFAHAVEEAPFWESVYRQRFGEAYQSYVVERNEMRQQAGIDHTVATTHYGEVYVDVKAEQSHHPTIPLEWQQSKNSLGWAHPDKQIATHVFAYTCPMATIPVWNVYVFLKSDVCAFLSEYRTRLNRTGRKREAKQTGTIHYSVPPEFMFLHGVGMYRYVVTFDAHKGVFGAEAQPLPMDFLYPQERDVMLMVEKIAAYGYECRILPERGSEIGKLITPKLKDHQGEYEFGKIADTVEQIKAGWDGVLGAEVRAYIYKTPMALYKEVRQEMQAQQREDTTDGE